MYSSRYIPQRANYPDSPDSVSVKNNARFEPRDRTKVYIKNPSKKAPYTKFLLRHHHDVPLPRRFPHPAQLASTPIPYLSSPTRLTAYHLPRHNRFR
jgi:hypothetical protein